MTAIGMMRRSVSMLDFSGSERKIVLRIVETDVAHKFAERFDVVREFAAHDIVTDHVAQQAPEILVT